MASSGDKRRQILGAAVRVFARTGYESSRVADIAREAGVAYGLVYHYFESKEDVLNAIFREHLGILGHVIDNIDRDHADPREKLSAISGFVLESYQVASDVVRVLLLEVVRSSMLLAAPRVEAVEGLLQRLEGIIREHQRDGSLRSDVDPRMASHVFLGSLETLLTGFALGTIEPSAEALQRAKDAVIEVTWRGLSN